MREIVRKRILEKYKNKCVFCGSNENLQVDHIIPLSRNGKHDEDNMQILCKMCNLKKGKGIELDDYFKIGISKDYILISNSLPIHSIHLNELKHIIENKINENDALFGEAY